MTEESGVYLTTIALGPALVRDAEAAVERLNRQADTARPVGLADLVAAALLVALGGECGCGREELDVDDAARLREWKRERSV